MGGAIGASSGVNRDSAAGLQFFFARQRRVQATTRCGQNVKGHQGGASGAGVVRVGSKYYALALSSNIGRMRCV